MNTVKTLADLDAARTAMKGAVALVPTMGALHAGHAALIERARDIAHRVIVSVFVNPTQFGPSEDFDKYPRPIEDDLAMCEKLGVDLVFNPDVAQMYPPHQTPTHLVVPTLAQDLEAAQRPGHFDGVCRVCCKLFNLTQPHVAVFGRKDYQQLKIIEAMVDDLNLPLRIEPVPTVREDDGLALSSRNRYLDADQRKRAIGLHKALQQAKAMIESGETDPAAVERTMRHVMQSHQVEVDYAVVRHPHTLGPIDCVEPSVTGVVALVAGRVGATRLLDNVVVG